jgi:hypothetical protein
VPSTINIYFPLIEFCSCWDSVIYHQDIQSFSSFFQMSCGDNHTTGIDSHHLSWRKNWLFSASPKGAASSAIVYTMVEMAKANDLNTYKYLTYLLSQRPDAKMSDEQLEQLAPWSETAKANCQN